MLAFTEFHRATGADRAYIFENFTDPRDGRGKHHNGACRPRRGRLGARGGGPTVVNILFSRAYCTKPKWTGTDVPVGRPARSRRYRAVSSR